MRYVLAFISACSLWLLAGLPANAACGDGSSACFWIGGGANANWNTTGNWSNTSGGASSGTTPATGDSICFDSAGNAASTLNANYSVVSIDFTGACTGGSGSSYTQTLTHNAATTLTITGNNSTANGGQSFRLSSGMTYTTSSTSQITFAGTSGTTGVTSAGKTLRTVLVDGVGGTAQLQDDIVVTTSLTLTNGTLATNDKNLTTATFSSSNSNTRALTCGSTNILMTSTGGASWNTGTSTNLTITSCDVTLQSTTASDIVFTFGGASLDSVTLNLTQGTNLLTGFSISSSGGTIGTLTTNGFRNMWVGGTLTLSNAQTLGGASASTSQLWRSASASGIRPTITFSTPSTANWAAFSNIGVSGTLTTANSMDLGNNSGFTVNPPSGSGQGIIGGGL